MVLKLNTHNKMNHAGDTTEGKAKQNVGENNIRN